MSDTDTTPAPPQAGPQTSETLENEIVEALKTVFDPEIPVNIYELGLIYDLEVQAEGQVAIKMTLTSPGCPSGNEMMQDAKLVVEELEDVRSATVDLVWEPYWTPEKMDPRVKAFMGF